MRWRWHGFMFWDRQRVERIKQHPYFSEFATGWFRKAHGEMQLHGGVTFDFDLEDEPDSEDDLDSGDDLDAEDDLDSGDDLDAEDDLFAEDDPDLEYNPGLEHGPGLDCLLKRRGCDYQELKSCPSLAGYFATLAAAWTQVSALVFPRRDLPINRATCRLPLTRVRVNAFRARGINPNFLSPNNHLGMRNERNKAKEENSDSTEELLETKETNIHSMSSYKMNTLPAEIIAEILCKLAAFSDLRALSAAWLAYNMLGPVLRDAVFFVSEHGLEEESVKNGNQPYLRAVAAYEVLMHRAMLADIRSQISSTSVSYIYDTVTLFEKIIAMITKPVLGQLAALDAAAAGPLTVWEMRRFF
ncbi:hypothetical protein NLG97_g10579 [Lecanicillium saksenae]|uniref:Uncharacterized protein n=1 Tax=Lecanicillium saksenae TaxID=468837 RepID=A0ACC1QE78_9HYPO|nr:hypothetical protein NLG97_g10579 [Lecanicillium saksenae]